MHCLNTVELAIFDYKKEQNLLSVIPLSGGGGTVMRKNRMTHLTQNPANSEDATSLRARTSVLMSNPVKGDFTYPKSWTILFNKT
jgi:hypothetical protein